MRDTTRQPSHEGSRRSIRMLKLLACIIFGIGPHFILHYRPTNEARHTHTRYGKVGVTRSKKAIVFNNKTKNN